VYPAAWSRHGYLISHIGILVEIIARVISTTNPIDANRVVTSKHQRAAKISTIPTKAIT
jgi:hypothetical protein